MKCFCLNNVTLQKYNCYNMNVSLGAMCNVTSNNKAALLPIFSRPHLWRPAIDGVGAAKNLCKNTTLLYFKCGLGFS